jgi:hypothetical protein
MDPIALRGPKDAGRLQAALARWKDAARDGKPLIVKVSQFKSKRSNEQNRKMWAMLTDLSKQVDWYGKRLTPHVWKCIFSAAMHQPEVVPGLDGGFVVCAQATSEMGVGEMVDLIERMFAFGADPAHPVHWSDPLEEDLPCP